jgi:hypothetical protein
VPVKEASRLKQGGTRNVARLPTWFVDGHRKHIESLSEIRKARVFDGVIGQRLKKSGSDGSPVVSFCNPSLRARLSIYFPGFPLTSRQTSNFYSKAAILAILRPLRPRVFTSRRFRSWKLAPRRAYSSDLLIWSACDIMPSNGK